MVIRCKEDEQKFADINRRYNAAIEAGVTGQFTLRLPADYKCLWGFVPFPEGRKFYFKAAVCSFELAPAVVSPVVPLCFDLAKTIEDLQGLLKRLEGVVSAH